MKVTVNHIRATAPYCESEENMQSKELAISCQELEEVIRMFRASDQWDIRYDFIIIAVLMDEEGDIKV